MNELALPDNQLHVSRVQVWRDEEGTDVFVAIVGRKIPGFVKEVAARQRKTRWIAAQIPDVPGPVLEEFDVDKSGVGIFYDAVTDDDAPPVGFAVVFKPRPLFAYAATHCESMVIAFEDGQSGPGWNCWPDDIRGLLEQHGIAVPERPQP